ncbi:hypothetical protein DMJ37_22350 [Vibrio parahaemolyticus]|nr:hypothetical protein D0871_00575 [Vibrio parahaemolyticus]EGQ9445928.1 hypothetical protein [Vibrio parahaemolyticus]EGR3370563.1 hypothetical protein [Vibrio parahaemolyticus]MUT63896.1 hypothetical protein [Vibrio parahaemolyticus]WCZ07678.1 hypothetical protein GSR97_15955 [Vibrio parahaemolyticus]
MGAREPKSSIFSNENNSYQQCKMKIQISFTHSKRSGGRLYINQLRSQAVLFTQTFIR